MGGLFEGEGLIYLPKFGTIHTFSSNQKMVSTLHKELGCKVETQADVVRGIAAKDQNKSELLAYE